MIDEVCKGWSPYGRRLVEMIWQTLMPIDARDERKAINNHFRVFVSNTDSPVVQLTDIPNDGKVKVKLTLGEDSPLIGFNRPLQRSKSGNNPAELARGEGCFTLEDIDDLRRYIDAAFNYCRKNVAAPYVLAPAQFSQVDGGEADDDTDDNLDHRQEIARQIRVRRGQKAFRDALRLRFEDRCAITGCSVLDVLEAAHIKPYRTGERDNEADNGLLLKADIHTLFDLDLIGINPDSLLVELHLKLNRSSEYEPLKGKPLRCSMGKPRLSALRQRYEQFELACQS